MKSRTTAEDNKESKYWAYLPIQTRFVPIFSSTFCTTRGLADPL
jgi:hypothetical protein